MALCHALQFGLVRVQIKWYYNRLNFVHVYQKLEDSRSSEKDSSSINTFEYFQSIFSDAIGFFENVLRTFSVFFSCCGSVKKV